MRLRLTSSPLLSFPTWIPLGPETSLDLADLALRDRGSLLSSTPAWSFSARPFLIESILAFEQSVVVDDDDVCVIVRLCGCLQELETCCLQGFLK